MNNIYIIAYCFYAFIVYLAGFLLHNLRIKGIRSETVLFFIIIIGALIAAFRPEKTQDTEMYNLVYEESLKYINGIRINGFSSIFANRSFHDIELFYVMIMACFRTLFKSPVVFYFIQGIIVNSLMIQGLYLLCEYIFDLDTKYKKRQFLDGYLFVIYSLYIMFCGLLYMSSAIRDGLSIGLGLYAIGSLLNRKRKIIALAFMVMSILIHTTSLVLIGIYALLWLWKSKMQRLLVYGMCLLIPVLYFARIGAILVGLFTIIVERILETFHIQAFYSYINTLDYQLPMREGYLIVLTCLITALFTMITFKSSKYIAVVIFGMLLFTVAYPIPALARLLYIFILFLIPTTIQRNKNWNYFYLAWGLYFVPQYIYVFSYL